MLNSLPGLKQRKTAYLPKSTGKKYQMVSPAKLEVVSQEYNGHESPQETSLLESSEISQHSNQSNASFLEDINIENETINSTSPTLTSHHSCSSTQQQQSFNQNHATPTQKLSPRISISEQNISQSHPELRSLLYSHQHLPLQQQQYLEHIFVEDQYRLQQMIQSQASLGQIMPANYCPQQHQQYQMLADCGQVQIEESSTSFLQPYQPQSSHSQNSHSQDSHSQNSHLVLRHQNNVQRKSQSISESERQRRRLERNRVAARQCRERKKVYVSNLESKVTRLEEENAKLRCEVLELNAKLQQNPVDVQENERLHILTEELKARLYAQEQRYQQSNQLSQEQQQEQQKEESQQQQQQYVNKEYNNNSLPLDAAVKDENNE
ncbi:Skn-1-like basic-leucine zipper transcription factor [Rhizophagus clarus]|uniref:Skn-1-like basic-leucine zipper transcription factor n=1 Tax=Rhizophagus clarus TaxID=94130 RepID=A0A8H3QL35_9GLOM|nr:Skn-1-like basic-leucine zipper transcription factor [Rhizophagus clarus]